MACPYETPAQPDPIDLVRVQEEGESSLRPISDLVTLTVDRQQQQYGIPSLLAVTSISARPLLARASLPDASQA